MKPIKLFTVLLLLGAMVSSCSTEQSEGQEEQEAVVTQKAKQVNQFNTVKAEPMMLDQTVIITGRLSAIDRLDLFAQVQGIAGPEANRFKAGQSFRAGETLLSIDKTEFENNLNAQRSQFMGSLLNLMADIKSDYPSDFQTWNRYLTGLKETNLLANLPEVRSEKLRYFLTSRGVYNQFYTIRAQEKRLDYFHIKAPFTGSVTMANVSSGGLISPGVKLGEMIRTDLYELEGSVSLRDIDHVQVGQVIALTSGATGSVYQGSVVRIGDRLDQQTQTVPVYLRLSGEGLKEGMYLEGRLATTALAKVVPLPKSAVSRTNQVYVIAESVVGVKDIQPVAMEESTVWVAGLAPGDMVIVDEVNTPILGLRVATK